MKLTRKWALIIALAVVLTSVSGYLASDINAVAETSVSDPTIVLTSANPIPDIADRVRPAVVQVIAITQTWDYQKGITDVESSFGSGVYIDDRGYIVTNNHVIAEADRAEILWLDGTRMEAEIVGTDSSTDLAVLKFEGKVDAVPVPMGDSDALRIGELAIAIGNPGTSDTFLYGTTTYGIISGLNREGIKATGSYTRPLSVIQTTAQINSGNSGGALLNGMGELIGIPTIKSAYNYTSVVEGIAFAIPVNTAKPIIDDLIEYGIVIRPRIGVTITDNEGPKEIIRSYPPAGAIITNIEEGSPAEKSGLQIYDIITHVNGERCMDTDEMQLLFDQHEAGETITLSIARYYNANGKAASTPITFDVDVELQLLDLTE
ncbi:MAG: PDZ domain-containing protein [Clostridiales bacterium]|nr:PDZ domain-containing protein [Clostridiales bacterium]